MNFIFLKSSLSQMLVFYLLLLLLSLIDIGMSLQKSLETTSPVKVEGQKGPLEGSNDDDDDLNLLSTLNGTGIVG